MNTKHIERVARRYIRANIDAEEVLRVRVDGEPLHKHIDDFARRLIKDGRETFNKVQSAMKTVEGYYPPDKVNRRDLAALVAERLERVWGDDSMKPRLAEMLVYGEYVF